MKILIVTLAAAWFLASAAIASAACHGARADHTSTYSNYRALNVPSFEACPLDACDSLQPRGTATGGPSGGLNAS